MRSPISVLGEALQQASTLKNWATVLVGAKKLATVGAPPRIVIFPATGSYAAAHDNDSALKDVDLQVAARLWGRDIDEAAELETRYFQALDEQGLAGGLFWQALAVTWSDDMDTTVQGQELEILINVRISIDRVAQRVGEVAAVQMTRET